MRSSRRLLGLGLAALVSTVAACASPSSDAIRSLDALPTTPPPRQAEEPPQLSPLCLESLRPLGPNPGPSELPEGSFMSEIQDHGALVVGVDDNTRGLSYRTTSGEIEGFEVELAEEIATRIFGRDEPPIELVPVVTAEKVPFVEDGTVDLTISAVSMSCSRWEDVAFSSEYLTATQEFLVRGDSQISSAEDLAGQTVCVTRRSTSSAIMDAKIPDAELLEVGTRGECLMALQQGDADAYFGHDTFLYGMMVQDPTMELRTDILPTELTTTHYGIAISHEHPEFVRFVNGVLDELRDDGSWQTLYGELATDLGIPDDERATAPPEPQYQAEP
jgi:polar amino acid transport system substrate-binding protein